MEVSPKGTAAVPPWKRLIRALIAAEISQVARYTKKIIQIGRLPHDPGDILDATECKEKSEALSSENLSSSDSEGSMFLLNGNINYELDIQSLLTKLHARCSRSSRVAIVAYNPYLRLFYRLANFLKLREAPLPTTFILRSDLTNIARLAGFHVVRSRSVGFFPWSLAGVGVFLNRVLAAIPILRWFGVATVIFLRPIVRSSTAPSVSVIIPARNERENIEKSLTRMPSFAGKAPEIVFVEGHSNDGTWEEIERLKTKYSDKFRIQALKQHGRGKSDAVRLGCSVATGEVLMILDSDLTMPPEQLTSYLKAYTDGLADFINGNRLVYPMEREAMRFLNWLGNVFFAKLVSAVLEVQIGDTLCGSKIFSKYDYDRFVNWRKDFGEFDPFGDFELLFPAAQLGVGILDIPIRYHSRTYGTTNISRFVDGARLLKMTVIGLWKIRLGAGLGRH